MLTTPGRLTWAGWRSGEPPPQPNAAMAKQPVITRAIAPAVPGMAPSSALLTEPRRIVVRIRPLLQLRIVGVELDGAGDEHVFRLRDLRIGKAALDGANGLASFVIVEADALGAELGVDH